ncbi:MAG: SMC-Scp complex subunit ScpB [Pyrinomonadaceae bacterium]|nr:SMC-Scp complex subunit ScpB [Phycisphaerales bacterium]
MTQAPADITASLEVSPSATTPPATSVDPVQIAGGIEAILFSTDRPVQAVRLASALGLISDADEAPADSVPATTDSSPTALQTPDATQSAPDEGKSTGKAGEPAAIVALPKQKKPRKKAAPTSDAAALRARAVQAIRAGVDHLNHVYEESGRSFRIESLAGGFRVMTLPEFSGAIAAFQGARARTSLSPAALEALAIVSYKQPITRSKLEAIRGVACGEILRSLMERRLVTIVGRAEELGRPMLYGTTGRFLELFGLSSLKDLPTAEELRSKT